MRSLFSRAFATPSCAAAWTLFLALATCTPAITQRASAVEPWADERLPVDKSLILWLDASRQDKAFAAHQRRPLVSGARLDAWYDASGRKGHFFQPAQASQPRFQTAGDAAVATFDGQDDFLSRLGPSGQLGDFTLIVLAAPRSNAGFFRALFAMQRLGHNDYTSGMTFDMGGGGTARLETLCPEGVGFSGSQSLLAEATPFGDAHVMTVVSQTPKKDSPGRVELFFNGKRQKSRPRTSEVVSIDSLFVGARCYSNSEEPPFVSGFLDGEIGEVLLFERALGDSERAEVEKYLESKYASLAGGAHRKAKRLQPVADPPPVQMFVPGFEVRQLPVQLTNVNNVRYRPDGKLVALAYSGDIYLLSDSDGDGLEDRVETFWENQGRLRAPMGIELTPPGYPLGFGVFTPSKGKCSLLLDRDGDDRADEEVIVADGWQEGPHGVDAVGVARDPADGSIYFALGAANYANAYLIDERGKAGYDLASERGTVLKVTPDFQRREIYCTGTRFPCGLAFNAQGDLFGVEQEGATWLPNGNPFDELLHIQQGRHYGFPPRHPRHLPGVIDEPSVFDYSPQHQSTTGLFFNEPFAGGPVFGPIWWRGDALVCGYSRGKLYRTTLVKTPSGYIARNQILGALSMLTADACVSPRGELVVTVHSGGPDWGTGPTGEGKLYKVLFRNQQAAQPVAAWAASPHEVRIAFDKPIDPELLQRFTGAGERAPAKADQPAAIAIEFGEHVRAGDRFESFRPGYEIVARQLSVPRGELAVRSVQVSPDRRTLIVSTAAHQQPVHYAVTLPGLPPDSPDALPQHAAIDLDYDLTGVDAEFSTQQGETLWKGWLPHFDLEAARRFTEQSSEHQQLWKLLQERRGVLTLAAHLNLTDMLRPAVQPGARIDYSWPQERVQLHLSASAPFSVEGEPSLPAQSDAGGHQVAIEAPEALVGRFPLKIHLQVGETHPRLEIAWTTNEDDRRRALPLHRILSPWAPAAGEPSPPPASAIERPELAGGDWGRGRRLFFSELAGCAKCHTHFGAGGKIGPDLSNLADRDFASVHRDVTQPSYAINPDFLTYAVELSDGRVLSGSVRTEGGKLQVGNEKGEISVVDQSDVELLRPLPISTMPTGIVDKLGPAGMKDLLTFLLSPPPRMPEYGPLPPPAPRSKAEVAAVLDGAPPADEQSAKAKGSPFRLVLVDGPKDHGPGEHDYPAWRQAWARLFSADENVVLSTASEWPSAEDFASADCIVFYQHGQWNNDRAKAFDAYLQRGGGAVFLHFAVDGGQDPAGFADRIGLAWQGGVSRFRHGELMLDFAPGKDHPIARNFGKVGFHDESYWKLIGDRSRIKLLADGEDEGQRQPLFWTSEQGKGRVFVSILGHFSWTFDDPLFRVLLLRGIAWSGRQEVDRFNDLVLPGARVQ